MIRQPSRCRFAAVARGTRRALVALSAIAGFLLPGPSALAAEALGRVRLGGAFEPDRGTILRCGGDFVASAGPTVHQARPERRWLPIDGDYRLRVFLNFDGATLRKGGSNAPNNETMLISVPTYDYPALDWARFGGREHGLKETLTELKLLFGEYAVEFVTERPSSGDFTMVMIGGRGNTIETHAAGAIGVAPLDCRNDNPNDVALVFGELAGSAQQMAFVIAHELGHTFGLEHVADPRGIMYPALTAETCCWVDGDLAEPSTCGRTSQDAHALLRDNVGIGPGDTIPPLVWLVRPGAGAVLPPNFSFEAGASDDLRVHHVTLFVDGEEIARLSHPPYVIPLHDLAAGEHVLRVEASDWKPNTVSVEQKVIVDPDCPATGSCYFGSSAVGAECTAGDDCTSGLCVTRDDGKAVCTVACVPGEETSCPDTLSSCRELGGEPVCAGEGDGWSLAARSSGCGLAGQPDALPWLVVIVIACLVPIRARRSASAARTDP